MEGIQIVGSLDLGTLAFILFFVFFWGLVFYIQKESRREGYPLEEDTTGRLEPGGNTWLPEPKAYLLPTGETVLKPDGKRDPVNDKMKRLAVWSGAPYEPIGDPMKAEAGPGAYTLREDKPDLTHEGLPKIVPMRLIPEFSVSNAKNDPRGMTVVGADGNAAGVISDIWMDRAEALVRLYEVELAADGRRVLLPYGFANVRAGKKQVVVDAIYAEHFNDVPAHASPDQVTRLEEDKIAAYYGAGTLYANKERAEPLI